MILRNKTLFIAALSLVFFSMGINAQTGATVSGKVYDKTINQKVKADWVVLVKTGQGLETVKQFDNAADYEFTGVPVLPNAPYLLRASYKGVVYTQNLMIQENKRYNVDLVVYEATSLWQNISVRIPHMVIINEDNRLEIQETFEINNSGQSAYHVSDAAKPTFRFKLPEGTQLQNVMTSHNQSMPLAAIAFAFQDGMGINMPLRPGTTQIQLTYTADYSANAAELNFRWYYDIQECNLFLSPKDIQVVSERVNHVHDEKLEANNFSVYTVTGIKADEPIRLTLSGGTVRPHEHNDNTVAASENMIQQKVFLWIFLMLSVLSFALFFGINRKTAVKAYQPKNGASKKINKQQKNDLIKRRDSLALQIAQLDDTFSENKIDSDAYQKRRRDLKMQLHKAAEDVHAV